MRAVDYVTHGFGGPVKSAPIQSVSTDALLLIGRNLIKYGLPNSIVTAAVNSVSQNGPVVLDQAIEFFSRYDQSLQALSQMMIKNNWTFGGLRGREAVYEAVRRTFNAIASQVGTNPLINAYTKAALTQISQSQAQEYKFLLGFIGQYLTESLRRIRSAL